MNVYQQITLYTGIHVSTTEGDLICQLSPTTYGVVKILY